MHYDLEFESCREQFRALIPEFVWVIRRALEQGSIQAALALLAGATSAPHPHSVINSCRKECWAMLPRAVRLVEHHLRAGDLDVARQLARLKKTKSRVGLLPAGVGLQDCGRSDLVRIATWMLGGSRLTNQERALILRLRSETQQ